MFSPIQSHRVMYERLAGMVRAVEAIVFSQRIPDPELLIALRSMRDLRNRHLRAMMVLPPYCDTYYVLR